MIKKAQGEPPPEEKRRGFLGWVETLDWPRAILIILIGAALIWFVTNVSVAFAQAAPVELSGELSHPRGAVAGQEVSMTWRVTHATVPITRCEFSTYVPETEEYAPDEPLPNVWGGVITKTMPEHDFPMHVTCHWKDGDLEPGFQLGFTVPLADLETIRQPPACYPAPIGAGTMPNIGVEDGVMCGAWHCPAEGGLYTAHGFCADVAELWSLERVLALTDETANTAWSEHDWLTLSEYERQRLMQLAAETAPAPPEPPPAAWRVIDDSQWTQHAFSRKADGGRTYSKVGVVQAGDECDCSEQASFAWGNWCRVQVDGQDVPIAEDGSGGAFANCEQAP